MNYWLWNVGEIKPTGKPKYSVKNLPQCHFVRRKSHMDWSKNKAVPPW